MRKANRDYLKDAIPTFAQHARLSKLMTALLLILISVKLFERTNEDRDSVSCVYRSTLIHLIKGN